MPTETDNSVQIVLRDLAAFLAGRPEDVRVSIDGGAATIVCAPSDRGAMLGRDGQHGVAFARLAKGMGVPHLHVEYEPDGREVSPMPPRPNNHDPRPAAELLERVLETLPIDAFKVTTRIGETEGTGYFQFDIEVQSKSDAWQLRNPSAGLSLLGSLGTLFRAAGKQRGVRYQINVVNA